LEAGWLGLGEAVELFEFDGVEAGGVEGGAESGRWKLILVISDILFSYFCRKYFYRAS